MVGGPSSCPNPSKGGHGSELGELPQVLRSRCQQELVACAARPSQSQPCKPQDALEVGKQHLDLLAGMTGALKGRCPRQGPSHISRVLIQIAWYPAPGCVGAAAGFQLTALTVRSIGVVQA